MLILRAQAEQGAEPLPSDHAEALRGNPRQGRGGVAAEPSTENNIGDRTRGLQRPSLSPKNRPRTTKGPRRASATGLSNSLLPL